MTENVYDKLSKRLLKQTLRNHLPVFDGVSSGFHIEHADDNSATVIWKNAGTDETLHRDVMGKASRVLQQNGYHVRRTKPANTSLIVKQVVPVVAHTSESVMGPFEQMVERLCEAVPHDLLRWGWSERGGRWNHPLFPKRVPLNKALQVHEQEKGGNGVMPEYLGFEP